MNSKAFFYIVVSKGGKVLMNEPLSWWAEMSFWCVIKYVVHFLVPFFVFFIVLFETIETRLIFEEKWEFVMRCDGGGGRDPQFAQRSIDSRIYQIKAEVHNNDFLRRKFDSIWNKIDRRINMKWNCVWNKNVWESPQRSHSWWTFLFELKDVLKS
jgi:hypothetical protein